MFPCAFVDYTSEKDSLTRSKSADIKVSAAAVRFTAKLAKILESLANGLDVTGFESHHLVSCVSPMGYPLALFL